MKISKTIKESGMYKLTLGYFKHNETKTSITHDNSEFIIFVTGVAPFLKIENTIWSCYSHTIDSLDSFSGLEFDKIEKL